MQFKETKSAIQVLKYVGYNREKKRAEVKMIGSLSRHTYEPSVGLLESMTAEETEELLSYIKEKRQSKEKQNRQTDLDICDWTINRVADSLGHDDVVVSPEKAAQIWASLDMLAKSLKKKGYPKPTKQKSPPLVSDRQTKLID